MRNVPGFRLPDDFPAAGALESMRRLPRHNDEALTGTTRIWLRKLPPGRRPERLCTLYPRVANQIAWAWRDPALRQALLDDLLVDRRGGRMGFPKAILLELRRLRDIGGRTGDGEPGTGYLDALRQMFSRH